MTGGRSRSCAGRASRWWRIRPDARRAYASTGLSLSTRSSNITSPSSVRWTGHLAAMVISRWTWSSVSSGARRTTTSKRVGQPRSAGRYWQSTSTGPTSQPLRWAYISSVIAVQEASEAASSSWGLGAASSPPESRGSSAPTVWVRMVISCWRPLSPRRRALAFIPDPSVAPRLETAYSSRVGAWPGSVRQRVEDQAGGQLRIEECRFGRHRLPGGRHLAHLGDRRRAHEEAGVERPLVQEPQRLTRVRRVAQPVEVGDVLLAHPQRALEHQRLEHRRVEPPIRRRPVGQRRVGDRLVAQLQLERPPQVGVQVAEPQRAPAVGDQRLAPDLPDVEVAAQRVGQGFLTLRTQAGDQAVDREDGEPGVLEGD